MRFFTICAKNYLPYAIALGQQIQKLEKKGTSFEIFLADRVSGFVPEDVPFKVTPLQDVGLVDEAGMITRYNITELNTAIKPYCFLKLLRESDEPVVYMDPDTYPVTALTEVRDALQTHNAVLTPHTLTPIEIGPFRSEEFSRLGIYNLGFLGLAKSQEVMDFLVWWAEKLERQCVIDIPRGVFVDQKWADHLPAYVDGVKILRHPGYNVAYWNLMNRRVTKDEKGKYSVRGEPLKFFHFSGLPRDEKSTAISTRHDVFSKNSMPALGELLDEYREAVKAADTNEFSALQFSYFLSPDGATNLHAPELKGETEAVLREPGTYLPARQFWSFDEYVEFKLTKAREIQSRREHEHELARSSDHIVKFDGYDFVLGRSGVFRSSYDYAYEKDAVGNLIPNWREHVALEGGYCNRIRAAVHLFFQEFQPKFDADIYMTEQATALYQWMGERFPNRQGSEYLGEEHGLGKIVNGLRNENVEALTFDDEQFDYILSLDVFEHVAFHEPALREMYRTLRPGGTFIFGVPPNGMNEYEHVIRAELIDGEVVHHMEPEYHGNPVDEDGALCFRYYGWKLLDELREIGFANSYVLEYWSDTFGYLGPDQLLFVAEKPRA